MTLGEVRWQVAATAVCIACVVQAQQQPPEVEVAVAAHETITDRIEAIGTLRANESVEITATVTETIEEIGFADGERVKKGRLLAAMSSREERALLTEAMATAVEARKQYDRALQLAQGGAASTSHLDEARRNNETAQARLNAIESRYRELNLIAPFDGVVGLRRISVGALVRPGDVITTLDDDSTMKLDFPVPSTFLAALKPGAEVEANARGLAGKVFRGRLTGVDSRIDPVTRAVVARAELPNPDRTLKPGLLMAVELLTNPREAVLVPESALLPLGDKVFVLVVEGDGDAAKAAKREIRTGARRPGSVEIVSGLEVGERVVTNGTIKAPQGGPIRIRDHSGAP